MIRTVTRPGRTTLPVSAPPPLEIPPPPPLRETGTRQSVPFQMLVLLVGAASALVMMTVLRSKPVFALLGAFVMALTVLGVLAELFRDSWGIRTADVLSAALLTLARIPQATLVWLVPLLTNPAFRRRVLALAPPDPLRMSSGRAMRPSRCGPRRWR